MNLSIPYNNSYSINKEIVFRKFFLMSNNVKKNALTGILELIVWFKEKKLV